MDGMVDAGFRHNGSGRPDYGLTDAGADFLGGAAGHCARRGARGVVGDGVPRSSWSTVFDASMPAARSAISSARP